MNERFDEHTMSILKSICCHVTMKSKWKMHNALEVSHSVF